MDMKISRHKVKTVMAFPEAQIEVTKKYKVTRKNAIEI